MNAPAPLRSNEPGVRKPEIRKKKPMKKAWVIAVKTVSQDTMRVLMAFDWPGNVRQFENAIEHAVAMAAAKPEIGPDALDRLPALVDKSLFLFMADEARAELETQLSQWQLTAGCRPDRPPATLRGQTQLRVYKGATFPAEFHQSPCPHRRDCFLSDARRFCSSLLRTAPRPGRVGRRALGGSATSASICRSFSRQSATFRPASRNR